MLAHDPSELVDVQLKAYNARDMDAFLQTYAADAEVRYEVADGQIARLTLVRGPKQLSD